MNGRGSTPPVLFGEVWETLSPLPVPVTGDIMATSSEERRCHRIEGKGAFRKENRLDSPHRKTLPILGFNKHSPYGNRKATFAAYHVPI